MVVAPADDDGVLDPDALAHRPPILNQPEKASKHSLAITTLPFRPDPEAPGYQLWPPLASPPAFRTEPDAESTNFDPALGTGWGR